jgi:hypothetical protein
MANSWQEYWRKIKTTPLRIIVRKIAHLINSELHSRYRAHKALRRDNRKCAKWPALAFTYLECLQLPPQSVESQENKRLCEFYFGHQFDLLGSGWREWGYAGEASGVEGHSYRHNLPTPETMALADWLALTLPQAYIAYSQKLLATLPPDYSLLDWQKDIKSGFRWDSRAWYKNIRYGLASGADIKVPWELGRMQHLPQLAVWYRANTPQGERIVHEFCHEIIDFVAMNPPGFGVQWASTMDVAIRVANWLIAYDILKNSGAEFTAHFVDFFAQSVYAHGRHIVGNLEYSDTEAGNHYLSDIGGLLFVAAYLARTAETDVWLAFAVQELICESERQFYAEGSNFEGSTSYHRLTTEMVSYATALVLGLPADKMDALRVYDHTRYRIRPTLQAPPLPLYRMGNGRESPFPAWYWEKLARMADFIRHTTRPDGLAVQIGDNDSGRFTFVSPQTTQIALPTSPTPELHAYPEFGLFVYQCTRYYLCIRCGGKIHGNRGHCHNDQLSFELAVGDVPFVVDPGTYLYSALPERRNQFRATASHNTISVPGREQSELGHGVRGLFKLYGNPQARVREVTPCRFVASHCGFGEEIRREFVLTPISVHICDYLPKTIARSATFSLHCHPQVRIQQQQEKVILTCRGQRLTIKTTFSNIAIEPYLFSAGYGKIEGSKKIVGQCGHSNSRLEIEMGERV